MPRIRLKLNLGTADARRVGLNPADATDGATVDVTERYAAELVRRNWAEAVDGGDAGDDARPGFKLERREPNPDGAPAFPIPLHAVPPVDIKADEPTPDEPAENAPDEPDNAPADDIEPTSERPDESRKPGRGRGRPRRR